MKKLISSIIFVTLTLLATAQKGKLFKGMYLQWGYNKEWYTKSNIRFKLSNGDNFKILKATAHDKPDLDAVYKKPAEISIPQYNYRIGFYLNESKTKAIELNFDHIKYVVTDGQTARVKGTINGVKVDGDSVLNPSTFLHLEHTDGGNLLHINYVQQNTLLMNKANTRPLITFLWKAGAGINIPRTDFTYRGDRFNNDFHVAGYNFSGEAGARFYFTKRLFLEGTGKTGYVRYLNALANTNTSKGNRVRHGFGYFELVGLIGYDFKF
ncbi:hypothetical protein ACFOWM_12440 [Ferruginibacter yonginensis]|uniref:Uncharacterized protein n=1 Tax=Ferruginibacter yonginensis TaxID=1310416 RepID=A0ABV8QVM2_9BACT